MKTHRIALHGFLIPIQSTLKAPLSLNTRVRVCPQHSVFPNRTGVIIGNAHTAYARVRLDGDEPSDWQYRLPEACYRLFDSSELISESC